MSHLPADIHRRLDPFAQPTANTPTIRPHVDRMAPYHWLYWALIDAGRDQLAAGTLDLIRGREFALREWRWCQQRQAELTAEVQSLRAQLETEKA